jgi:hypothetical protein
MLLITSEKIEILVDRDRNIWRFWWQKREILPKVPEISMQI